MNKLERIYDGVEVVQALHDYPNVGKVPIVRGEFWTARQRATHLLHQVSYRACFKANLPEFFIERLSREGDLVYDCFMGRGTTPLQAILMGRRAAGCDVNPISKVLCSSRLNPPSYEAVEYRLAEMELRYDGALDEDLLAFYHPYTLRQIYALREILLSSDLEVDQWIQMVATNRLTGHSKGFFSVHTMPPNQAVTANRQRMFNAKNNAPVEPKEIIPRILKKTKRLLADDFPEKHYGHESLLLTSTADQTAELKGESVQLIVTSPPFLDVVNYARDNWLRCWFNGVNAEEVNITSLRNPEEWADYMKKVFVELERVLKPKGFVAFEVGEVKKGKVLLEEWVILAARETSLRLVEVLIHEQEFTKTANCWGVANGKKGTNTHRVVLFQKPE